MENDPPYKDLGNFIDDFSNIDSKKTKYPKRNKKNKTNYADDIVTRARLSTDLRAEDLIQIVYRLAKRNVDPRFRKAYRDQLFKLSPSELEYELKQVLKYYSESDISSKTLAQNVKEEGKEPAKKKEDEIPENV